MSVKVLYTTHAIATGGRNGHTRSADGIVDVDLSIPKAMGGLGKAGATTPEDGGFGLVGSIAATVGGLPQAEAEKLVAAAHVGK